MGKKLNKKGYEVDIKRLVELDNRRREVISDIEMVRAERNKLAEQAKGAQPNQLSPE